MEEISNSAQISSSSHKTSLYLLLGIAVSFIFFGGFYYFLTPTEPTEIEKYHSAYIKSLEQGEPKELQQTFVNKVQAGEKDALAKSAIYFISHRYFDNKGNIYEIYDYINSNPPVYFLKEAEEIYPGVFSRIKAKQVEIGYNFDSMSAFLSYLEVVDNHGYADVATLGTASNKHAELALEYEKLILSSSVTEDKKELYRRLFEKSKSKSIYFFLKAQLTIEGIVNGSAPLSDIYPADVVVGINQYAHTMQFFKALGVKVESRYTANQLFDFSSTYAKQNVPELYLFTNFLSATSLIVANEQSTSTVSVPLDRIVTTYRSLASFNQSDEFLHGGVLSRIINAKTNHEKGSFSQDNIIILAKLHPSLKTLLLEKGWLESDFK